LFRCPLGELHGRPEWRSPMPHEILTAVLLATRDADLGLVPADKALEHAQELADEEGKVVYLRHPETDKLLGKAKPAKAAKL
jgi:hypothetical protein